MVRFLVPREHSPGEKRVAATPETVRRLLGKGVSVKVQQGAGAAAGFRDDDFLAVGAELAHDEGLPWEEADGVLCVQAPPAESLQRLRPGALLVGLLSPYGATDLAETLNGRQASAIALELLPRISRAQSMDVLSSQANIAGYKAVLLAAAALDRYVPMLMTAAGTIQPSRVLVLGAGVAGLQALATAQRLGHHVEVLMVAVDPREHDYLLVRHGRLRGSRGRVRLRPGRAGAAGPGCSARRPRAREPA